MIVLIVEDDPMQRELLARVLRQIAAVPIEAATIEEAQFALSQIPKVDVVISDWSLPDGTAKDLRVSVPVIVLSGYDKPPGGEEWRGPWLRKPLHLTDLKAAVLSAIMRAGE